MTILNKQAIAAAAQSLVIRAREGDENAMGMITVVRENAAKGNERAKASMEALEAYIKANPVPIADADIGAEAEEALTILKDVGPIVGLPILLELPKAGDDALFAASVILANGNNLLTPKLKEISDHIESAEDKDLFRYAVANSYRGIGEESYGLPLLSKKIFFAGLCIGLAITLQHVRLPKSDIARLSPMAGWELS